MGKRVVTIGDVFKVRMPGKDQFYVGDKDGAKCWPLRFGQGCYGARHSSDCEDCRSSWEERQERLALLPLDMLQTRAGVVITIS